MSSMTLLPTLVFPFQGVLLFPPESAPVAIKSLHATPKGLIEPLMFGPNIRGKIGAAWITGDGAFQKTGDGSNPDGQIWGSTKGDFSASRSSNLYGSSSTVQPASIRLVHCVKF